MIISVFHFQSIYIWLICACGKKIKYIFLQTEQRNAQNRSGTWLVPHHLNDAKTGIHSCLNCGCSLIYMEIHMKHHYLLFVLFIGTFFFHATAAKKVLPTVQPAFWWAGMHEPELQILIHGEGIGDAEVTVSGEKVTLLETLRPENSNYLILHVNTQGAPAQTFRIQLKGKKGSKFSKMTIPYVLEARQPRTLSTFSAADVVYLLMPDRFCNGDPTNDVVSGMRETTSHPTLPDARQGGDLAGVVSRMDYLADLGVTALWMTPTLENDMPSHSYHGYAITDYYRTDPRYGSNEDYRKMVQAAHDRGIKVIMDMVFNHCGSLNPLFAERPANDWFNYNSQYVQTSYKISAVSDPHAADEDARNAQDGWFVEAMPDWNQKNPEVLRYLIQNSIWWIEYAGIDGIRQDTYPYADMEAMATWCKAVEAEYPGFNIVGETWLNHNVGVSFWQKDSRLAAPRNSELPTVMDFPLMNLLTGDAITEETNEWDKGLARVYDYLSQDGVYADPMHLLTFVANHDTPRFAQNAQQAQNLNRYRQALTLLLTLRGIPQLYTGDEIGMYADKSKGDGALRQHFPGGFPGDAEDAFTAEGRTPLQNEIFGFTRKLLQWRKGNKAISEGDMKHFSVKEGVYVYSRQTESRTVTVFVNGTDHPVHVSLKRYQEVLPAQRAAEIISGKDVELGETLPMEGRGICILDFKAP